MIGHVTAGVAAVAGGVRVARRAGTGGTADSGE